MSHSAVPTATCPFTGASATDETATAADGAAASASSAGAAGVEAPVADWVTIPDLYENPFPIYQRLREESPVHWVPELNRYMVTSYAACHEIEQDEARAGRRGRGSRRGRRLQNGK